MEQTITSYLVKNFEEIPQHTAYKVKENGTWKSLSWSQFFDQCGQFSAGLKALGLKKGDAVSILSNTRLEWGECDIAILSLSAITVPIYQSSHNEEIEYILNNSQSKVLICENKTQLSKWEKIKENCPHVKHVLCIDCDEELRLPQNGMSYRDCLALGEKQKDYLLQFKKHCESVKLSDTATLIYTSGTTGLPKGVILTHTQLMSEVKDLFSVIDIGINDITLSFLPYAHVMGRVEFLGSIYSRYTIAFAESIEKIKANLMEVRPTLLIAVPRIFEKIYNGILSQIETHKLKNYLFKWALKIGKSVSRAKENNDKISFSDLMQLQVADKMVFSKIKEKMGGRLRYAISGGAPLAKEIGEFFHAAGLLLLEGYGLTETSAAICINTPLEYKFGTVGKPLGDVEIHFDSDGEILVKSDKVMKEYFQNKEATESVFVDGFFRTGDIGEFTSDGFLKITDRKKDLIKTAGGKYVAPQRLENILKLSPFISNVLIHGDQKKYIVSLITLDEGHVLKYAKDHSISFSNYESLTQDSQIKELIRIAVADANRELASYESIKKFEILPKDFTIESGELTPSLKVKRKICDERYKELIDSMYGVDRSTL